MLQTHHRARPGAARPRARPPRRRRQRARRAWSELCEELLSGRGEASGVALAARNPRHAMRELTTGPRIAFFEALAQPLRPRPATARCRHRRLAGEPVRQDRGATSTRAAEPRRQELFRRLNLAPGGTAALVRMREQLLDAHRPSRRSHGGRCRFRPSVLVVVQPRLPGAAPDRLVDAGDDPGEDHPLRGGARIRSWDDLRRRIDPPDRRCYAFFHPALVDEPLIFVEVALTREIPGRDRADPVGAARAARARAGRRPRCSIRSRTASAGSPACRSATS